MRIQLLAIFLAAVSCVFFKLEAQNAGVQPTLDSTSGTDFRSGLEQQTFDLINQYRKENKLPLMEWNSTIAEVARAHSRDMATGAVDFGHDGFTDRVKRIKSALIGLNGAGENVFETSDTDKVPELAVNIWLHSPHHLKNIRGDYTCSGLGVWQNKDGVIFITQIFVKLQTPAPQAQVAAQPAVITPFGYLATPNTR